MKAAALRINKILVRREFWENRSLWIVPSVVIGLFTLTSVLKVLLMLSGHVAVNSVDDQGVMFNGPDMADTEPGEIAALLKVWPLLLGVPFNLVMLIVVFFYMLDCLYADRRDRSVLFWRSMPLSDGRAVLAKLFTGMFSATVITLGAVVVTELITILLAIITGGTVVKHPWVVLAHPVAIFEGWLLLAYALVCQSIWFLPFYGWWMLASAWAKKAPLLWAVLPPVLIMVMEGVLFRTGHFAHIIWRHTIDWIALVSNVDPFHGGMSDRDLVLDGGYVSIDGLGRFLASPELWIGLVIGAAFIYGAIWLRRTRSEI